MKNRNAKVVVTHNSRPSSPRKVGMRGIGAAPHLYPALQACGMTKCVARQGFTLIELLVVVLIIGILAAVAVPQYQKAVEKSRIVSALPLLKAVYDAQQVYYLANGEYATSAEQLDIDFTCPEGVACAIGKGTTSNNKFPKMELRFINSGLFVVLYYSSNIIENTEVKGKPYCTASTSNTRAVAICKSFGPVFASEGGYSRVFIQP